MRSVVFGLRQVGRELKSGEVRVLAAALALAVAAMTAVGFFTDRIGRAVELRSAEVLAADLVLRSNRPIDTSRDALAGELGLDTARTSSFPSVVLAGDNSALADIEAVSPGYPLRGQLKTSASMDAESGITDAVPDPGEAWADPRLLARLGEGADVGMVLEVGRIRLRVTRLLDYRPDQGLGFVEFAPTLMINLSDVEATGLIVPGSRVSYRLLVAGEPDALDTFRKRVEPVLGPSERLRDLEDAQPQIRSSVERAGRFIGLASVVSALIAAVAVAMAARRFASRRMTTVALMKCVGATRGFVLGATLTQLAVVGLLAALAGIAVGYLAQEGLVRLLSAMVGDQLPPPTLAPAVSGLVLSGLVLAGFALVPVIELCRTPPGRVLRRDLLPASAGPLVLYGAAAAGVVGLLWWQIRDADLLGWLLAGTVGAAAALVASGWLLVRLASRLRGGGTAWRYGLANVGRRGRESIAQVAAFGIGLMVLILLTLVRSGLLDQWRATLPEDAPNRFLINIQPDEADPVQNFLAEHFGGGTLVPLVRARLVSVNGRDVADMEFPSPRAARLVDREANLSWAVEPSPDNRIIAGQWWDSPKATGQVSVEEEFARDLGLSLGDTLSFDVAGSRLSAEITSLRTVQWDSFNPNFFMVFPPAALEGYPRTYISSVHVERADRGQVLELVRQHPSVTVIDIEAALDQVRSIMDQASLAVQYVFLFALGAGVLVMLAVVQSTREERLYESAMLRTLGAKRSVVLAGVAVEFSALGVLSGLLAAAGATAVAWILATRVFNLEFSPDPWVWLAGTLGGMVLVGGAGVLATRSVVTHAPVNVLKRY